MMMTAFLESTVQALTVGQRDHHPGSASGPPLETPSGCAFSISSSKMTLSGRRRTASVTGPPPIADIAGRSPDKAADGMRLHVLGHVDARRRLVVVEQEMRESPCQLGLADAGRTEEDEAAQRAVRVREPGARAADSVATAMIASSCPITRSCSRSSIFMSFSISPSTSRLTGTPVQRETISAMSSPSTSSFTRRPSCAAASCCSASRSCCSSCTSVPYCSSAARFRS